MAQGRCRLDGWQCGKLVRPVWIGQSCYAVHRISTADNGHQCIKRAAGGSVFRRPVFQPTRLYAGGNRDRGRWICSRETKYHFGRKLLVGHRIRFLGHPLSVDRRCEYLRQFWKHRASANGVSANSADRNASLQHLGQGGGGNCTTKRANFWEHDFKYGRVSEHPSLGCRSHDPQWRYC